MSGGSGPHDALFRRVLGEPSNAASQLRAVLPKELVGRLELDRLTPVNSSYVDPRLRWRHSDLLFTVPLEGREAFLYVLVEHQSGTDKLMPFRMLRYVVRIWDRYLRLRPLTPLARMALLLLKIAAGNQRLAADLRWWVEDLRAVLDRPGGAEDFKALLTYIEIVGEAPTDELQDLFTQLGPEAEGAYVTTAEMLRAEGEARGRAETLLQQLTYKFGPIPPATHELVHTATADQLEAWTVRVLTADTLDEILR